MTEEFGVIEKMRIESTSAADNYRGLQGYTAGIGDSQLFVMQKAISQNNQGSAESKAKLVEVSYTNTVTEISSDKTNLKHGNDCAYYNGYYYVVTRDNAVIYEFKRSTLNKSREYSCEGLNFSGVSCIAHISGNYFLLGSRRKLAVCEKRITGDTSGKFVAQTLFKLDGDTSDAEITTVNGKGNLTRQGMYVSKSGYLFKAYGQKKTNGQITTNYIAKWELDGTSPKYTGCTLKSMYDHTNTDRFLFEVESISAGSSSMYAAVRIEDNGTADPFKAKLYRITF